MSIQKPKSKKHILVIDDDEDIQNFLRKILEGAGYHCRFAANVEEGISSVKTFAPHLIILDYKLNEEIGFEVIEFLRASQSYKNTPLILISAKADKKIVLQGFIIGANEFMAKPINPSILLQTIKKHLKLHELPIIKYEQERPIVRGKSIGDIIKINELGMVLQSSVKLFPKVKIDIESPFLNKIGAGPCNTFTHDLATVPKPGTYRNEIKFRGMDEKTAKKIRNIKQI